MAGCHSSFALCSAGTGLESLRNVFDGYNFMFVVNGTRIVSDVREALLLRVPRLWNPVAITTNPCPCWSQSAVKCGHGNPVLVVVVYSHLGGVHATVILHRMSLSFIARKQSDSSVDLVTRQLRLSAFSLSVKLHTACNTGALSNCLRGLLKPNYLWI
jgi:hypothetical protein